MVEQQIGPCYPCQLTDKQRWQEQLKLLTIPTKPWDTISIDLKGPY